ncbi:phosphonate ABC transporter, permease protein PhnE [Natronococcus pandeyae]|uniref:Phosphonate ABC transporter, permease protein PhnE n=1 Tax=Natronococcus pandeyae TaxID=2055836 RepID=A0A8J8PWH7_9EURY|nr:phosphonate ABC transporter, permease protein PhnE [Natronococcus pandeyae]TYL36146.1 phosphonate ABC transporter, permease protein PhnE [Natronococcus pandeyae]
MTGETSSQLKRNTANLEWERFDTRTRLIRYFLILFGLLAVVASWSALDINTEYVITAPEQMVDLSQRMYPPDVEYAGEIVGPLIETIHIAVLSTGLAVLLAAPVAYIAAENTTFNRATYYLGKLIISFTRSVNVIIWALIFVVIFGPGALAGIVAVAVRSIGFVAKLLAEAIEEIDMGSVEAISATGANPLQILIYGIIPQIKPAFITITTFRWDINVRGATIIGFVGAGGIGTELMTRQNSFDWSGVLTILIAILFVVVFSEMLSAYLRKKVA